MRATAVIPAFNEEDRIAGIVRLSKKHCHRVIVVDNNSTDDTIEKAENETPYVYVNYIRGAGATTGVGLAYGLNPLPHLFSDTIVALDGDGQHDPNEIDRLLAPIRANTADMVIGSRFLHAGYKIRGYRKFGIDVITWFLNIGHGTKLTDGQCCFRAFSRDALKKLLPVTEIGFGFSVEMIVKARRAGLRIVEVPVSCIYHEDTRSNSTINPVRHGVSVLICTIKWRLWEIVSSRQKTQ